MAYILSMRRGLNSASLSSEILLQPLKYPENKWIGVQAYF